MAYEDEVAPLESVLVNLIAEISKLGNALDDGEHNGITIDSTVTKAELTVVHNALLAAFNAYESARIDWYDALP